MPISPKRDRKAYDIKYLDQFVGCEVEFKTTSDEHLMGMLTSSNHGRFTFTNLRKAIGNHDFWAIRQTYSYGDLFGKFVATGAKVLKLLVADPQQMKVEKKLQDDLHDKPTNLISVDDTSVYNIIDGLKPKIIVNPDIKDLDFESIDFSFTLNQEQFQSTISNNVTRHTSHTDPTLKATLKSLASQQLIGLTLLPFSMVNRTEPIEFILLGCTTGTYIFTVNQELMLKLKPILESKAICKVLHDSCITSARIYRLFNIDLDNIDDTLVLETHYIDMHMKQKGHHKGQISSYAKCVKRYLDEKLPWAQYDHYYQRCGKGKLLAAELDETGLSYARSLVMLLPELRLELLKHCHFPIMQKTFCYANYVKYASDYVYNELRSKDLITPRHLASPEGENEDSIDMSGTEIIGKLLKNKFNYFNHVKKPMTQDSCTQTEPEPINPSIRRPSYRRVLGNSYPPSPSPSDSSSDNYTNGTKSNNKISPSSSYTANGNSDSAGKRNGQVSTNGRQFLRMDKNDPRLSEGTNEIDWDSLPRISSSESWGIKQPSLLPAGFNN